MYGTKFYKHDGHWWILSKSSDNTYSDLQATLMERKKKCWPFIIKTNTTIMQKENFSLVSRKVFFLLAVFVFWKVISGKSLSKLSCICLLLEKLVNRKYFPFKEKKRLQVKSTLNHNRYILYSQIHLKWRPH